MLSYREVMMSVCVGAKTFQEHLQSLGVTSNLAKPKMKKEVGRAPYKMTERNVSG